MRRSCLKQCAKKRLNRAKETHWIVVYINEDRANSLKFIFVDMTDNVVPASRIFISGVFTFIRRARRPWAQQASVKSHVPSYINISRTCRICSFASKRNPSNARSKNYNGIKNNRVKHLLWWKNAGFQILKYRSIYISGSGSCYSDVFFPQRESVNFKLVITRDVIIAYEKHSKKDAKESQSLFLQKHPQIQMCKRINSVSTCPLNYKGGASCVWNDVS